jgi:hypothetical protein
MLDYSVNRHDSLGTEQSHLEFNCVLFGGCGAVMEDEPGNFFMVPVAALTLSVECSLKAHYYIGLIHYHQGFNLKMPST